MTALLVTPQLRPFAAKGTIYFTDDERASSVG